MELNDILETIKTLTDEDKAKVQEFLAAAPEEGTLENAQETDAKSDEVVEETAEAVTADIAEDKETGVPGEQVAEDEKELVKAVKEDEKADEEVKETEDTPREKVDEPIPDMSKSASGSEADQPIPEESANSTAEQAAPLLQDEQGGEMPIDYQQIIDGLNAKNLALETENKQLKAKMEGAFGLTSKPGAFAPVNNLYGDTSDIPIMRK